MKELVKKWWFWFIIISLIGIAITTFTITFSKDEGVGTAGISIEEYKKIDFGMTQIKVNSIIDTQDEWNDNDIYAKCCEEIEKRNKDGVYTYVYKYIGEKSGYAEITYEVDYSDGFQVLKYPEVVKKEKFNLK